MSRLQKATPLVLAALLALTACTSSPSTPAGTAAGDTPATAGAGSDAGSGSEPEEYEGTFIPAPDGDVIAFDLAQEDQGGMVYTDYIAWNLPGRGMGGYDELNQLAYITPYATSLTVKLPAEFAELEAGRSAHLTLELISLDDSDDAFVSSYADVTSDVITFGFDGPLATSYFEPARGSDYFGLLEIFHGDWWDGENTILAYFQFDPAAGTSVDLTGLERDEHYQWVNEDDVYGFRWGQVFEFTLPEGLVFSDSNHYTAWLSSYDDDIDLGECAMNWAAPGEGGLEMAFSSDGRTVMLPLPADALCSYENWYLDLYSDWYNAEMPYITFSIDNLRAS
jgi:hypothetical protein